MKPRNSEISAPPGIAVGTHFPVWHGTKTTQIFVPACGEAFWWLLSNLVLGITSIHLPVSASTDIVIHSWF